MNLKGYTQFGLLTGIIILVYQLVLIMLGMQNSPLVGLQYLILFAGIFISIKIYDRENILVILDLFMVGIRTMSSTLVVLVIGAGLFYMIFPHPEGSKFTYNLMMVIFPFGMSGALSSLVSAIIVNKLLKTT